MRDLMDFGEYAHLVDLISEGEIEKASLIAYFLVKQIGKRDFKIRDVTALWQQLDVGQPNVSRLTGRMRASAWFPRSANKNHFRLHLERVRQLDAKYPDLFTAPKPKPRSGTKTFIDKARIDELRTLNGAKLDVSRLVRICEEINTCYEADCLMAVALLARTLINHVPSVFGFNNFSEVANNYGGVGKAKSFKKVAQKLEESARNIGDMIAHEVMRRSESLPSPAQIDFSQELDVLLGEVARVLKEGSQKP